MEVPDRLIQEGRDAVWLYMSIADNPGISQRDLIVASGMKSNTVRTLATILQYLGYVDIKRSQRISYSIAQPSLIPRDPTDPHGSVRPIPRDSTDLNRSVSMTPHQQVRSVGSIVGGVGGVSLDLELNGGLGQSQSQVPGSKDLVTARSRDECFDAIAEWLGVPLGEPVGKGLGGTVGTAVASIRAVEPDLTPQLLKQAFRNWPDEWARGAVGFAKWYPVLKHGSPAGNLQSGLLDRMVRTAASNLQREGWQDDQQVASDDLVLPGDRALPSGSY